MRPSRYAVSHQQPRRFKDRGAVFPCAFEAVVIAMATNGEIASTINAREISVDFLPRMIAELQLST